VYSERLYRTLVDIVRIPSTSGHEEQVRDFLAQQLTQLGLAHHIDAAGNLITTLPGERGKPLLLNAHMDRVPPGRGHEPVLRAGVLYSDGTTNLGADDAAGITIILELLRRIIEQHLPHPPLVIVFTVQEEAGLCGASGFDSTAWNVEDGIVFDNAFEAGVVVSQGATYEAFDVHITGRTGHPGKDLSHSVNAIEIFHAANYPHGSLDDDQTRINIGHISGGSARNAIPASMAIAGELRSFAPPTVQQKHKQAIQAAFQEAATRLGGHAEIVFTTHSSGYKIDTNEPLLDTYRNILASRGASLEVRPTFIGSDTSGFRPTIKAFTVSTGVFNEHTSEEYVALAPLEQLVQDALLILKEQGK